jgi:hypothetical protein
VTDVCDEVASNNIHPPLFGQVVDQDQDCPGAQRSDAHPKLEQLAAQRWPPDTHFLLASIPILDNAVDEVTDIGHGDFASTDQAQGIGTRTRPQDGAVRRHDE